MAAEACQNCGALLSRADAKCKYCGTANSEFVEKEAEREEDLEAKRRQLRMRLAIGGGAVLAIFIVMALVGQSGLRGELAEVERSRAQVKNVIERQVAVEVRYRNAPAGPDRDAELSGAENRVRIERARYDEAAAQYNADAGSFLGGIWSRLFGLPPQVPLSNEVTSW